MLIQQSNNSFSEVRRDDRGNPDCLHLVDAPVYVDDEAEPYEIVEAEHESRLWFVAWMRFNKPDVTTLEFQGGSVWREQDND